jgi:dTDP-4-amino-4,6-dideoxygalactose transaminase
MKNYDVDAKISLITVCKSLINCLMYHQVLKPYQLLRNFILPNDSYRWVAYYFNYGRNALRYLFDSLHLAGKSIVFPGFICPSLVMSAMRAKAKPILVDVDINNFNIDIKLLSEKNLDDIKCVLVVHTFGIPVDIQKVKELTQDCNIYLIEDVAQALFAKYNDRYVGSSGDAILFSMYKQTPNLYGAILLSDTKMEPPRLKKEKVRVRDITKLIYLTSGPHQYLIDFVRKRKKLPTESNIFFEEKEPNDLSFHIFGYLFQNLEKAIRKRNTVARYYVKRAKSSEYYIPQDFDKKSTPSWFNFSIRLVPELSHIRDLVILTLRRKGIFCDRLWYNSPVVLPYYQKLLNIKDECPNATLLSRSVINLPIRENYSREDVDFLFNKLEETIEMLIKRT